MEMTYIFILITIVAALLNLFLSKQPKTINRVFEVFLVWFLFIMIGIGCIWAFIGHVFMSNFVATSIGWPAGNPFQLEVGVANLAFGILGILSIKIRDNFLLATVIAASIFLLGAGIVHITNIMQTGNMAPGNAGFALLIDILIPVVLIILMVGYKLTKKSEVSEN
ncbi:MAG TPA: hypothetical protein PLC38_00885 [Methanobacterium sp.]|nr:MAG: hypothetical protein FGO69_01420 [Methanobacterium sp.]HOI70820.1 hypothetical protein [Methanobacterium sp.]